MAQCIHLACRDEAWTDPEAETRKSYLCLDHAHVACRGHLLFTPPQLEVFNKEGFIDALVPEFCVLKSGKTKKSKRIQLTEMMARFPLDYISKYRFIGPRGKNYSKWCNTCMRCGKIIVSKRRHCGVCRLALDLPEDESNTEEKMFQCEHWRAEEEPGHVYLKECLHIAPVSKMVLVHGKKWCAPCRAYVVGISRHVRTAQGYDF